MSSQSVPAMNLTVFSPMLVVSVVLVALAAGTLGGVVGFGSAVLLLPVLSSIFGPQQTVPILTLAALIGNLSRAAFSWNQIDWRVVRLYCAGAVPGAIVGATLFVQLDARIVSLVFGAFVILVVPARRWAARHRIQVRLVHFPLIGAAMGFLSAVTSSAGPVNAAFFVSFGLVRGAYLATEAVSTAVVHTTKSLAYGKFAALNAHTALIGALLGTVLLVGAYLGKRIVGHMNIRRSVAVVELALIVSGVVMIAQALAR